MKCLCYRKNFRRDRTVHKVHLTVAMESPDRQMVDNDAECALILISALCNRAFFKPDQVLLL